MIEQILQAFPETPRPSKRWRIEVYSEAEKRWLLVGCSSHQRTSLNGGWQRGPGDEPAVHWSTIGVNTSARLRVTALMDDDLTHARIQPNKWSRIDSAGTSSLEFTLAKGDTVYIQMPEATVDTLFVAANPLAPEFDSTDENVLYFGPGEHRIGMAYDIQQGAADAKIDTVFLAAGAIVEGSINVTRCPKGAGEIKILGHGTLIGSYATWEVIKAERDAGKSWADRRKYMMVHTDPNTSVDHGLLVDGPTLVASPHFNFVLSMKAPKAFRHMRILAPWCYNSDFGNVGTTTGPDFHAYKCLIFNGDDTVKAEQGVAQFDECVFGGRNSILVGFGPGYYAEQERLSVISDCDVILQDAGLEGSPIRARVDSPPGKVTSGQAYRRIRVTGNVHRLFDLAIKDTDWGHKDAAGEVYGKVENILFDGVVLDGKQERKSIVRGRSESQTMGTAERPIVFAGIEIDGRKVTKQNFEEFFEVGPYAFVEVR